MGHGEKGRLVVISAPSGTGKSTVCRRLRAAHDDIAVSVSYTTRAPRGSERDGAEYHFVDDACFDRMIEAGEFLEWAEVFGKRYGSGRADVDQLLAEGKDVLFDIDVQGGAQIKEAVPEAVLIFLLPPSMDELIRRLNLRGTESAAQMRKRLQKAVWELEQSGQYDYLVVNDDLDRALARVNSIRRKAPDDTEKNTILVAELVAQAHTLFD
ncbi:MAG TPA: guanylate kinase [Myxococcota bacterium]|nr:guanylate kinase [Myxococcota bacterium]